MTDEKVHGSVAVNTVLGPISADDLGVVAIHEALLSVVPGAQYAPDITIDRAEIFETLAHKLRDFREHGGGTVVDSTGMFHGRDLRLYEALAASTGVHIIASTGMGPEEFLGGYFLTPQTNPPTPWPAEKFADLFTKEVTEGMVVPRVQRRSPAGIITSVADRGGITPTEVSLFQGSARAAVATGVPLSIRFGSDAVSDLGVVLAQSLSANRVLVGGLDRSDAVAARAAFEVARQGAFIALDHVGYNAVPGYVDDTTRANLVLELIDAGYANRIVLSSNATGVAKGHSPVDVSLSDVLARFVPMLVSLGVDDETLTSILVTNPRNLLTVGIPAAPSAV